MVVYASRAWPWCHLGAFAAVAAWSRTSHATAASPSCQEAPAKLFERGSAQLCKSSLFAFCVDVAYLHDRKMFQWRKRLLVEVPGLHVLMWCRKTQTAVFLLRSCDLVCVSCLPSEVMVLVRLAMAALCATSYGDSAPQQPHEPCSPQPPPPLRT